MNQNILKTILRVAGGVVFLALGFYHIFQAHQLAIFVPLPTGSVYFVYLVGLILVAASVSVIRNRSMQTAWITIALVLAISGVFVQLGVEWVQPEEILKDVRLANLFKMMIALVILLVFALRR